MVKEKSVIISSVCAFFFLLIVDQATKWWGRGEGRVTYNTGISFQLLSEFEVIAQVIGIISILVLLSWMLRKYWKKQPQVWALLVGAGCSNLLDRVIFGGVQDFLPVPFFNITNNIADWVITVCLLWVAWQVIREKDQSQKAVDTSL